MRPNQAYKLFHSEGYHKQNKRQPIDWEKILAKYAAITDLISKIYISYSLITTTAKPKTKLFLERLRAGGEGDDRG